MSSYCGSVESLSLDVLSCLLAVVFLFLRYLLSFVLRRLASVVLVSFIFPLCSLLELLLQQCLLAPVLRRYCPLLRVVRPTLVKAALLLVLIVTTTTEMVTPSLTSSRRSVHYGNLLICHLPWYTAKAPKADGKGLCRLSPMANLPGKESDCN